MMGSIIENPEYDCQMSNYQRSLVEERHGISVNLRNDILPNDQDEYWEREFDGDIMKDVHEQLTRVTGSFTESANELRDVGVYFGNECNVDYIYSSPCLVVRIPPASSYRL